MQKNTILKNRTASFLERKRKERGINNNDLTSKNFFKLKKEAEKQKNTPSKTKEKNESNNDIKTNYLDNTVNGNKQEYLREIRENTWSILPNINQFDEENITKLYKEDPYVDSLPYVKFNQIGMNLSRELLVFLDQQDCNPETIQVKPEPHSNILIGVFAEESNKEKENSSVATQQNILTFKNRINKILDKMNVKRNEKYEVVFNYDNQVLIVDFSKKLKGLK